MEIIPVSSYQPPVDQLLTYGEAKAHEVKDWPNYLDLGLTPEHTPALICMTTDQQLYNTSSDKPEAWAPLHAGRALGQLRALEAVGPLLTLFDAVEFNDWVIEEVPMIFGLIGHSAFSILETYVTDRTHDEWARTHVAAGIKNIGLQWSDTRSTSVAILSTQLEHASHYKEKDLSAFIVDYLIELQAKEAVPIIERAFREDGVNTSITGSWDRVQFDLGLLSAKELTEREARSKSLIQPLIVSSFTTNTATISRSRETTSRKAKIKMAKQSRKKNRKR